MAGLNGWIEYSSWRKIGKGCNEVLNAIMEGLSGCMDSRREMQ